MNEMLSYAQAAEFLGVKVGTLYSMVSRREVPFVRISKRLVRFPRTTLAAWVSARAVVPTVNAEVG